MNKNFYGLFPVNRQFTNETIWNIAGFILAGISGLGLQVMAAANYDPSVLGILNLTLIIFTVYSQISGFGIHFSVLKHIPEYSRMRDDIDSITERRISGASDEDQIAGAVAIDVTHSLGGSSQQRPEHEG
ncbi:MAG: hypothetical protein MUE56_10355, partial [Ignavibacteria bacterium]|nr:hypothetical protein [Ignavibacteria bacterium]